MTAYADVALDKRDNEFTVAEAKALVDPVLAAGDDTLEVEVGGPVAALSQTAPVGSEGIGLIAAAIILLVTFGSAVAMGLPLLTACSGSASRWRSARSCAGWSTSRTGRRRRPRWSASASASTTRCSSSPGSAAAWPRGRSRGAPR